MGRRLRMDKRGISPVVATVILVAVTIVVAVAVAYWMGGITGLYTRFEKLEIVSIYATPGTNEWTISVNLKNTGSADATIDNVMINGKPVKDITEVETDFVSPSGTKKDNINIKIAVGQTVNIAFKLDESSGSSGFKSGVSIEVRLHSAAGQDYPKTITLP